VILRKKYIILLTIIFVLSIVKISAEELVVTGIIEPSQIEIGQKGQISVNFLIPPGHHQLLEKDYFFIKPEERKGIIYEPTIYPEGVDEDGVITYYNEVTLTKEFTITKGIKPGSHQIKVVAGYQLCDDAGMCLFPEEVELVLPFNVEAGTNKSSNLLKYLLLALIGGLILNITPCVLPVLSIKAISLVNQSQHDKRKIMFSSWAYTAGILVSFLVLAIIVVIIKTSGELVGWGFQFQNPGFVIALLSIIFVFALSLFGVFTIRAPGMQKAAKASGKGGYVGSFVTGIFAVLLSTPCSAPLLGSAIGFAFTQPSLIIILLFLVVGLGLAIPFILLGFWPKAIQKLPKPGNWMVTFEQLMGFLLLAAAIWLLDVLRYQIGGSNLIKVLIFLASLGFAAWIYGRFARPQYSKIKQWIASIIAIIIIIVSGMINLKFNDVTIAQEGSEYEVNNSSWKVFSPKRVESLINENKPVFIDFTAKWCMTCKVNESAVLNTKEIQNAFSKYDVSLFRGDYTNKDEVIGQWMKKLGKGGVPVYVLYMPGKTKPILLPEILTKEIVLKALENISR